MNLIRPQHILILGLFLSGCGSQDPGRIDTGDSLPDSLLNVVEPQMEFGEMAESYESADRKNWQKPEVLIASLGDLSDKTVADLGAGTGYFTFRLAEKAKKVIAIDIDKRFLDYINEKQLKQEKQGISNIETRLTQSDDPSLQPEEAGIILTVNTYHLIENRVAYFKKVKEALAPGGKLVVVDFRKEELPVGPSKEVKLDPEEVVKELRQAGFSNITIDLKMLAYQYIVTAE